MVVYAIFAVAEGRQLTHRRHAKNLNHEIKVIPRYLHKSSYRSQSPRESRLRIRINRVHTIKVRPGVRVENKVLDN